jgi:hypothetical protein
MGTGGVVHKLFSVTPPTLFPFSPAAPIPTRFAESANMKNLTPPTQPSQVRHVSQMFEPQSALRKSHIPISGLHKTWRSNRCDNLPPMVSRSDNAEHPESVARSSWRALLYTTLFGLVVFGGIEICPAEVALLLFIFVVAILLLSSIVLLVCAAIGKNRHRYLQQLSTLTILLVVAVGVFIFGQKYPFAIRSEARWLAGSQDYKALVLAQPSQPNNELKHVEWDGSGFAGVANNTVYLAFDPADTLSTAAESHQPGKFNGIPCKVRMVGRLESHWYTVLFFTDETWDQCK